MANATGPFGLEGFLDDDETGTYLTWAEEAASRRLVHDAGRAAGWPCPPTCNCRRPGGRAGRAEGVMTGRLHVVEIRNEIPGVGGNFEVACQCGFVVSVAATDRARADKVAARHLTATAAPSIDELAELLEALT